MKHLFAMALCALAAGCAPFHESLRTTQPVAIKAPVAVQVSGAGKGWQQGNQLFLGELQNGRFQGKGRCAWAQQDGSWSTLEDCEYLNGFRVDRAWTERLLKHEDYVARENAAFWSRKREQDQMAEQYAARRQAEYEARRERRNEAAFAATAAAMRGDYSQAAAAGMPGASALQMAQTSNRQMSEGLTELQRRQAQSAPVGGGSAAGSTTQTEADNRDRVRQQQLRLIAQAQAAVPANAEAGQGVATAAEEWERPKETLYGYCTGVSQPAVKRYHYVVSSVFSFQSEKHRVTPANAIQSQWQSYLNASHGAVLHGCNFDASAERVQSERAEFFIHKRPGRVSVADGVEVSFTEVDWRYRP